VAALVLIPAGKDCMRRTSSMRRFIIRRRLRSLAGELVSSSAQLD